MGSKSGGKTETRYAPYIEAHHSSFLSDVQDNVIATVDESPFDGYTDIACDVGFFGTGYTLASFPSLYDMYGKFMAGLDVDALYTQVFEDTVNNPEVNELVSAEATLLETDIENNILPRFQRGMRDINSVMSSTFVTGKAVIENARVKSLAKFSAQLKYTLIPIATDRWKTHLSWNIDTVRNYAEIMKLYFSAKMDIDDVNYSMAAKDALWPFTIYEYYRAAIGALQGAMTSTSSAAGSSQGQKAISGALSGAAAGAQTGTWQGAAIGGVLGLASAYI